MAKNQGFESLVPSIIWFAWSNGKACWW